MDILEEAKQKGWSEAYTQYAANERLRSALLRISIHPATATEEAGNAGRMREIAHCALQANDLSGNHINKWGEINQENNQLCKDAERYRWLRKRDLDTISVGGVFVGMTPDNVVINGEDLDAAIDAAMNSD